MDRTRLPLPFVPVLGGHRPRPVDAPTGPERPATGTGDAERLRAERDEYLDALRRLAAEFDNYRKRMLREQTAHLDRAAEDVIRRLLPVLDTLELGARHAPETFGPVHRQLLDSLAAEGLSTVDPLGAEFDPDEHQAAEHDPVVPLHRARPVVTAVLRPGYRLRGRLLRPALVRVSG
ncbi:nucleotide exchange factor GrpE [Saccharopolyspora rosea]|uniref:nucleotide exchange factor GrpE n=1 Tax=Saccharopolyspora rosea TaxID=524884 RepID=UPI0021D87D2A|nr:nucleotide exchange factor GrpE [Saccharopolyspora rosea]